MPCAASSGVTCDSGFYCRTVDGEDGFQSVELSFSQFDPGETVTFSVHDFEYYSTTFEATVPVGLTTTADGLIFHLDATN